MKNLGDPPNLTIRQRVGSWLAFFLRFRSGPLMRERRLIRSLSRFARTESLTNDQVRELGARGYLFATFWTRYRASPGLWNEALLIGCLRGIAGSDLALAFFVRSEGRIPSSLPFLCPGFHVAPLSSLSQQHIHSIHRFRDSAKSGGTLSVARDGTSRTMRIEIGDHGTDTLYLVRGAMVYGGSGLIRQRSKVIWPNYFWEEEGDGLYPWDSLLIEHATERAVLRKKSFEQRSSTVSEAISLLDSSAHHFGHFVWGILPRLRVMFRENRNSLGWKVLIGEETPGSIFDLLEELGLEERLVTVPRGEAIYVEKLYIPKPLKYFPDILPERSALNPKKLRLVSNEFDFLFSAKDVARPGIHRVSLLRETTAKGRWRRCLNHDELMNTLDEEGFLDVSQSITKPDWLYQRLREASLIVTDDGSISANLLLAGVTGARIVVLSHPGQAEWTHPSRWTEAYLAFQGNSVITVDVEMTSQNRASDWRVDCEDLRKLIQSF